MKKRARRRKIVGSAYSKIAAKRQQEIYDKQKSEKINELPQKAD